jgi:hypothetical protein
MYRDEEVRSESRGQEVGANRKSPQYLFAADPGRAASCVGEREACSHVKHRAVRVRQVFSGSRRGPVGSATDYSGGIASRRPQANEMSTARYLPRTLGASDRQRHHPASRMLAGKTRYVAGHLSAILGTGPLTNSYKQDDQAGRTSTASPIASFLRCFSFTV